MKSYPVDSGRVTGQAVTTIRDMTSKNNKARCGRPRAGDPRLHRLVLCLTESENDAVLLHAKKEGLPPAIAVRKLALDSLGVSR